MEWETISAPEAPAEAPSPKEATESDGMWETVSDEGRPWVTIATENSNMDNVQAVGQKILDGVTLGAGEQVTAAGRATIDSFVGTIFGEDAQLYDGGWMEAYRSELGEAKKVEQEFTSEHPVLSAAIEITAGLPTAFGVGKLAGLGATRLGNVARQGGAAAVEGAVYGFNEGKGFQQGLDTSERLKDAAFYGALGAGIAGPLGALMRGASEKVAKTTIRDKSTQSTRTTFSTSNQSVKRSSLDVGDGRKNPQSAASRMAEGASDGLSATARRLRDWTAANVSDTAARKLVSVEGEVKRTLAVMADGIDKAASTKGLLPKNKSGLSDLHHWFEDTADGQQVKQLLFTAGNTDARHVARYTPVERQRLIDSARKIIAARAPAGASETFNMMYGTLGKLKKNDPGQIATQGYFPSALKRGREEVIYPQTGDYLSPVESFMQYADDVITSAKLARGFGVDIKKTKNKYSADDLKILADEKTAEGLSDKAVAKWIDNLGSASNTDRVIAAALKKDKGLTEAQKNNLAEALRANFVMSNRAPHEFLTGFRGFTSASLIATFSNAMLNAAEIPAAAYKNGIVNTLSVLPRGIRSALTTNADKLTVGGVDDWIKAADVGVRKQFLGEIKSEMQTTVGKMLDKTYNGLFTITGGRSTTQLTQEIAINGAVRKARNAYMKEGVSGLRKLDQAKGLSDTELLKLGQSLAARNYRDPEVLNYGFAALAEIQPIATSSMPKAYLNHPNGRILYGLKSYLIQQMNNLHSDVVSEYVSAYRKGINTKEGRDSFRKATGNAMWFSALIGGANTLLYSGRKEVLYGEDTGAFDSPEDVWMEFGNQMLAIGSGGIIDAKAYEYGGSPMKILDAPALGTVEDTFAATWKSIVDADPEAMQKLAQSRLLFGRQADEISRILTRGDRLFVNQGN